MYKEESAYFVGKTLKEIKIAKDKQAILFVFKDNGTVIGRVDADCCSHTWIEHIELPSKFPAKITSVGDIPLNENLDTQDGELKHYGFKIVTNKGDLIIDYRNESNGYYGGSIHFGDTDHYGGVYGQNNSKCEWVDVKEDI
jgi:hypothetical protein